MKCNFRKAWIGQCDNIAGENGYCELHSNLICVSCGEKATRECPETMGLVCGAPLCDNCEHTICSNGCSSGAPLPEGYRDHCRKGTQVYRSWLEEEYVKLYGEEALQKLKEKHGE